MPTEESNGSLITIVLGLAIIVVIVVGSFLMPGMDSRPEYGLKEGTEAPAVNALGWLNSEPSESQLSGPRVVEAWATWCGPCMDALPEVNELAKRYGDRIAFVAVTAEGPDELPAIKRVRDKLKLTMPVGYGAVDTLAAFKADYIPATWLINSDGKIVWSHMSETPLETAIERLIADEGL